MEKKVGDTWVEIPRSDTPVDSPYETTIRPHSSYGAAFSLLGFDQMPLETGTYRICVGSYGSAPSFIVHFNIAEDGYHPGGIVCYDYPY